MASTKAALVTGAATGIGRAAALALARAGYDVGVNYSSSEAAARDTVSQAERAGSRTLLLKCDVSDEAESSGDVASRGKCESLGRFAGSPLSPASFATRFSA